MPNRPTQSGSRESLENWLRKEPFALGLSSGFFGFFAHCGLVSALDERELFPARAAGSSAGALVAGLWSAGVPAADLAHELLALQRRDFWDPWPGPGLLRGRKFRRILESLLPVEDFTACRWPLALSAFDALSRTTRVLDGGKLAEAIHASCAVPLMFQPVWIGARPLFDGGVSDRHGIRGVPAGERLFYHHLSSRSPWRRKDSPALRPPERPRTVSLIIDALPRVGPFRLENGRPAFELALSAVRRALDMPINAAAVRLSAERKTG